MMITMGRRLCLHRALLPLPPPSLRRCCCCCCCCCYCCRCQIPCLHAVPLRPTRVSRKDQVLLLLRQLGLCSCLSLPPPSPYRHPHSSQGCLWTTGRVRHQATLLGRGKAHYQCLNKHCHLHRHQQQEHQSHLRTLQDGPTPCLAPNGPTRQPRGQRGHGAGSRQTQGRPRR